ncbi:DNA primase [Litoribrevibacter albus]|uniref:DNA primase n=1 Tax=Litoribrevibacter albus TaxID=1473156 RepID=A0AA37W996_9GAMM|nr:DNA primase [Litoribrevibacter albus]GLQ33298.1 DNA primase [Litoribrevibacter albus]
MAGRIPEQFIDDVVARTDLVELIGNRIKLKKTGSNHVGLCPFHNEKSPSFSVSESKQLYHCFGCGASGNALTFLIEHDRLDFVEAIETMAGMLGMEVPREESSRQSQEKYQKDKEQKQKLYELMEKANTYFQQQLRQHPTKQRAVNYLKGRGMTGHTAKAFQLGFAPAGWDNLLKALGTDKDTRQLLSIAGLLAEKEQKPDDYYDRFRDRIIFPIIDTSGRTIAFGGRVLAKDEKPKYYNSPETPIFHKSQTLYGLQQTRKHDRHPKQLVVVEGYMDVIALAQHNIHNAVACLGTALTEDHVRLLFKQTSHIVFCFDGDSAGLKAAKKALEHSLSQLIDGREVSFLFLDDGEDPDTLVSAGGKAAFDQALENAKSVDQFLFSQFEDTSTLEGKARMAKEAMPMIQQVPGDFIRNLLTQELARRTGLTEDTLNKQLTTTKPAANKAPSKTSGKTKGDKTTSKSSFDTKTPFGAKTSFTTNEAETHHAAPEFDDYYSSNDIPDGYSDYEPGIEEYYQASESSPSTALESKLANKALRLIVHNPGLSAELSEQSFQFSANTHQEALLSEILHHLKSTSGPVSTGQLTGFFQDSEHFPLLENALANPPHFENINLVSELESTIKKLIEEQETLKMLSIKEKIDNRSATSDEIRLYFQWQSKKKAAPKNKSST